MPLIHNAVTALKDRSLEKLRDYAKELGDSFADLPGRQKDKPTVVYLDGYYHDRAERALVNVFHDEETEDMVFPQQLSPGHTIGCGSNVIVKALTGNSDPRLAKYRSSVWDVRRDARTLANAIDLAKDWMDAHCGPEAMDVDPEKCVAIGGIAHMCIVRPKTEFEWMFRQGGSGKWIACTAPTGAEIP